MAVKIKLKRMGKIRSPHYRIIVADARSKRDGRAIEQIGKYHPKKSPSFIEVDSERAQYWLGVGAQPTEPVLALLKVTGDWQKHKGLPGAEGTLQTREAKADKSEKFNKLLADVHKDDDKTEAKKRPAKKSAAKKATKTADEAKTSKADKAKAEDGKADEKSDDKPAKKAAAKKEPAKTAAKKADQGDEAKADEKAGDGPAKKAAAKKAPAKTAAEKADQADAADAPAEES